VSHYSFETLELFREVMARLAREHTGSGDSPPVEITTYVIELHFNQLTNESDRLFFNSVPTSLALPSKTVDRLRQLAARELADNAEFRRLVADLKGQSGNITFVQPSVIDQQSEVTEILRQSTHITTSLKNEH
jgi:hypothetical protein